MNIRRFCLLALSLLTMIICVAENVSISKFAPPTKDDIAAVRQQGRYLATITMADAQKIELVLEGAEMPYTVANFVKLINARFYDGLTFYQVINHKGIGAYADVRLVMGGDPVGNGGGHPGYALRTEISPNLSMKRGALAMTKDTGDKFGCLFIIAGSDQPHLDGMLPVFGWVKSGQDVVDNLKTGDVMKTVTVEKYNGKEPCPILADPLPPRRFAPSKAEIDQVTAQGRYLATMTMENGRKITIVLEGNEMPLTVANFIKLAQDKFYDGLAFYSVETREDFRMVQGGDPNGDGSGGPGYTLSPEHSNLSNKTGAFSTVRRMPMPSGGSQFAITCTDIPQLDARQAVFGWVKDGLDVVKDIKKGDKIQSITIAPYDGKEECPVKRDVK